MPEPAARISAALFWSDAISDTPAAKMNAPMPIRKEDESDIAAASSMAARVPAGQRIAAIMPRRASLRPAQRLFRVKRRGATGGTGLAHR